MLYRCKVEDVEYITLLYPDCRRFLSTSTNEEALSREEAIRDKRERLDRWLWHLSEREEKVLRFRWMIQDKEINELNGKGYRTLEEVAKIFNVTRERVRQIEKKAIKKIRAYKEQEEA